MLSVISLFHFILYYYYYYHYYPYVYYNNNPIFFFLSIYCYLSLIRLDSLHSHSVYVGQVDYMTTPEELLGHFEACGTVERVTIVCDKYTGKPKGRVQYITIVYYIYHNLSFFSVKRIIISSFLIPLSLSLSLIVP